MIEINDIDSSVDTVTSLLEANVARFFFETADFPAEAFQVTRFTGVEGISQPYRFTIDLVSQDSSIDFDRVVFQRAAFTMMRGTTPVHLHGEVVDFAQLGRVQHHAAYRAVLVPRLWRLRYQFRSHVYQRLTLQDLITEVLQGHDVRDVRFDLQGTYDPIEYCVQYQETDLAFIRRLMEREGWFFYFEQDDQKETLVITDHQGDLPTIENVSRIPYREEEGMVTAAAESVQRFICRERAGWPGRVTLKDHNYETPDTLIHPSEAGDAAGYGYHYEYGADHLTTSDQADERARRRMQELAGARHAFRGKSNCMGLRSGHQYSLTGHFRQDFNADYLLLKVKHRGGQESALGLAMNDAEQTESGVYYQNRFLCRRAEVPYRPSRRTPVPKVPGLMVAHIDHPDRSDSQDHGHLDEYAHLDADGRYKATVNFDEDRSHPAADHSLPIHVAQHYAGPDYGTHFPLHGGVEVLLACINGDPNRPFIVGTVPNPNHTSPVTSANKTQNIVRTFSGNEMLMEDQEGITKISLTTPGGHNETLDDGQQRIIMTSSGGHVAKLDDKNSNITVQTTDSHRLLMDDAGRQVILNTTDQHFLALSDEEQYISLVTTNQHGLTMTDADEYITLQTTGEHKLRMDDAGQYVKLATAAGNFLLMDDSYQLIDLRTPADHGLLISDPQNHISLKCQQGEHLDLTGSTGIIMESPSGIVHIKAGTEIKLEVGSNSITINSAGITISGNTVTSEATGGNNVITGTPDVLLNC